MSGTRLPNGESLDSGRVRREFRNFVGTLPVSLGAVPFGIVLPKIWTVFPVPAPDSTPKPGGMPVIVAQFNGPEIEWFAPFAQILCATIGREISAADWLRYFCERMNYRLRELDFVSSRIADASVGFQVGERVVAARMAVRFFGARAYIVTMGAAAEHYEVFKEQFGLGVRSFTVQDRFPADTVEIWRDVGGLAGLSFKVPQSWSVRTVAGPDGNRGEGDLTNRDVDGAWVGHIRLRWLGSEFSGSSTDEARKMVLEFEAAGVRVGKTIASSRENREGGNWVLTTESVHEAARAGAKLDFEFWQIVMQGPNLRVLLAMLTPSRQGLFLWWAINRRALEILGSTMS